MNQLPDRRRGERGSAYIIVLLALVVLTIVGLSLIMVTQTEVQLGANERTVSRTLFAADSGLTVAAAKHLVANDDRPATYIQNRSTLGNQNIAEQVQISGFTPISTAPCDFCPVNANGDRYYNINNTVTSTARRVSWSGTPLPPSSPTVLAQSQVTAMIRIANAPPPSVDSIRTP